MAHRLLRECIKALLLEAAVPVASAQQQGLALFIVKNGKSVNFVLYDPKHYASFLQNDSVASVSSETGGIYAFFALQPGDAQSCWGAMEVSVSSARKGYGPMMYDVVMSYAAPTPVMPDRTSVSDAAANVWKYYNDQRSDVEKKPLDNIDSPQTEPTIDDCSMQDKPELNVAFVAKTKQNIAGLEKSHESFVTSLPFDDQRWFVQNIVAAGKAFFHDVLG